MTKETISIIKSLINIKQTVKKICPLLGNSSGIMLKFKDTLWAELLFETIFFKGDCIVSSWGGSYSISSPEKGRFVYSLGQ